MSPRNLLLRNRRLFRLVLQLLLAILLLLAIVTILVALSQHPDVRLFERTVGLARAAQPLAAFTPLLVAAVALLAWQLSYRAHLQRERADERAEWWRRVQDGVALVTDPEKRFRTTGFKLLAGLSHFGTTSAVPYDDVVMLREIIKSLRDDVTAGQEASSEAAEPQSRMQEPAPSADEEDDHDGV